MPIQVGDKVQITGKPSRWGYVEDVREDGKVEFDMAVDADGFPKGTEITIDPAFLTVLEKAKTPYIFTNTELVVFINILERHGYRVTRIN